MSVWEPDPGHRAHVVVVDVDRHLALADAFDDFVRHWSRGRSNAAHINKVLNEIGAESARGTDQAALVRMRFRLLAGADPSHLDHLGRTCYRTWRKDRLARIRALEAGVAGCRDDGGAVVLVSRSLRSCLLPLGRDIAVDDILCTVAEVNEFGRMTGEVDEPLVGRARARAIAMAAARLDAAQGRGRVT